MRKITINWSYPMDIHNILNDSCMSDIDIYSSVLLCYHGV